MITISKALNFLKKLKKIPIQVILEAVLPVGQGSQRNIKGGQGLSGFHGWAAKIRKTRGFCPSFPPIARALWVLDPF